MHDEVVENKTMVFASKCFSILETNHGYEQQHRRLVIQKMNINLPIFISKH